MQKIILVTGTSTGLGASIALLAAQSGHKVYATMRDTGKGGALSQAAEDAGVMLNILPLDVKNTDSVNMCVEQIVANDSRIDVLINNAGSGFARSTEQAREEDIASIMNVNFMGVVRTTKAVIPHMRAARSGHIINISSVGGLVGQPFNEVYCASKFAVEGYTEALASYVQPNFGINFTAVEPGGIKSEFANAAMAHIQATGGMLQDEYLPILMKYVGGAQARGDTAYQTPDEVAQIVMGCIESENPPIRIRTSSWANDLCELKTSADPDGRKLQRKVIDMFLGG
jgi:NAD(P)-dependent dehydrogenase (short-subunit alcohol dehydrogenase family)